MVIPRLPFVPRHAAEDAIQNGLISRFDVEGVDYGREIYIVYCQNKLLTAPARDFIEMCGGGRIIFPPPTANDNLIYLGVQTVVSLRIF